MKRKTVLFLTLAMVTVLSTSSMVSLSQAWWPTVYPKPDYVGYSMKAICGPSVITYVDASAAPTLVILEAMCGEVIDCNITIGDKVYYYPDDFDYTYTNYMEINAITGEGIGRVETTITFHTPWQPIITVWGISRMTDFGFKPDGTNATPETARAEGEYKLTGTRNNMEGFGVSEAYFLSPEHVDLYTYEFGYIKGWSP